MYYLYVLIKDEVPVYVGLSSNVSNRISKHKSTKDFDSYVVLKRIKDKRDALNHEKGAILFLNRFFTEDSINEQRPLDKLNPQRATKITRNGGR